MPTLDDEQKFSIRASAAPALVALLLTACPSVSTLHGADPVAPGRWEFGAAADGLLLRDAPQDTRVPSGQLAILARRGLTDDLDAGLRLYTFGLDASARYRVLRGAWRLALIPGLGIARTTESEATTNAYHFFGQLPVVVTTDVGESTQLSFGPRALWGAYWPETGGSAQGWLVGGFFNASFALDDAWRLVPELSLHQTVHGEVPVDGTVVQLGVGLLWRP